MHSLSDLQEDVDYLANSILAFANAGNMTITMGTDDERVPSDSLTNEISETYSWTCDSGERSTINGCGMWCFIPGLILY